MTRERGLVGGPWVGPERTRLERLRATERFSVTELELFGDCSSMWLVERQVDPRPIDALSARRRRSQPASPSLCAE